MSAAPSPHIIGIRHHSPACARLVAERVRTLRPAYVLIEGPADFNNRLDELALGHRLPVAIYSYLCSDEAHHGSWSPLAEHSPEWQALAVGRELGAQLRFIDLPAWHEAFAQLENRYADVADAEHDHRAAAFEQALAQRLGLEGRDALWDHLFEDGCDSEDLAQRLDVYFHQLRSADDPGSMGNQAREQMMARWIAWAVAQDAGPVLVVCGGYHAPALARLWPSMPTELPQTPLPASEDAAHGDVRFGSYLVPYTFKRLDAFAGYASGMPSPAYYQWVWEYGAHGAAQQLQRAVVQRLREKKLPASTADLLAAQVRAQGLARLRGHAQPLRSDWLDALAGALVKDALDAPLPWTYRGPLRAGTDAVLVQMMDVLAGDVAGQLAPLTPQPPLVQAVRTELAALGVALRGELHLDLLTDEGRARSRVLHRLAILQLPGVLRQRGPKLALDAERTEVWRLSEPLEQHAALIEAGAWGATLIDAARAKLEDGLRAAQGHIEMLVSGLNRAAWAGLGAVSAALLADLPDAVAREARFEALAPALGSLHLLQRHGQVLGMQDAPVLRVVIQAGFDRALWLLEPAAAIAPTQIDAHLQGHLALQQIVRDALAAQDEAAPHGAQTGRDIGSSAIEPGRAVAVWQRKAACAQSAPVSRGAALGAVYSLSGRMGLQGAEVADALRLLHTLAPEALGDALAGLLALAREALAGESAFAAGMDALVQALDGPAFVQALPAMRAAFAWLASQERGALAEQVLALHGAALPRSALTRLHAQEADPEAQAQAQQCEADVARRLAAWGLDTKVMDDANT